MKKVQYGNTKLVYYINMPDSGGYARSIERDTIEELVEFCEAIQHSPGEIKMKAIWTYVEEVDKAKGVKFDVDSDDDI